nr:hypothetical protein [Desulfobacula sp.]
MIDPASKDREINSIFLTQKLPHVMNIDKPVFPFYKIPDLKELPREMFNGYSKMHP